MTYQPIESYGIIGDMHTVALVGTNGSIDWLCVPDFDSPSVFAAILDHGKGGCFKIAPVGDDVTCKQFYWPETNVLITRFLGPHGAAELADFMPAGRAVLGDRHRLQLVRRVTAVRGILRFRMPRRHLHPVPNLQPCTRAWIGPSCADQCRRTMTSRCSWTSLPPLIAQNRPALPE